jgi:hypothetical protein
VHQVGHYLELVLIVCLCRSARWNNDMSANCNLFSFSMGDKKHAIFACRLFANIVYWQCVCRCVPLLVNDQLDAIFQVIYFTPLHVSSNKCLSSGGSNCVNTSSGIIHSSGWLFCVPVGSLPTGTQESHPLDPAHRTVTLYNVLYQTMYWHNLILLMMSTCCSKHVEAWNKYIEKVRQVGH